MNRLFRYSALTRIGHRRRPAEIAEGGIIAPEEVVDLGMSLAMRVEDMGLELTAPAAPVAGAVPGLNGLMSQDGILASG